MSQEFKLKFDRLRENDPTKATEDNSVASEGENYPSASNTRNIAFSWLDGKRLFLNYAYLISGEYLPQDSLITLGFTTHAITLKGTNLEALFDLLMLQSVRTIACSDERYKSLENDDATVFEIRVDLLK